MSNPENYLHFPEKCTIFRNQTRQMARERAISRICFIRMKHGNSSMRISNISYALHHILWWPSCFFLSSIQYYSGWWLDHPSEKYESQLGWLATQYEWENKIHGNQTTNQYFIDIPFKSSQKKHHHQVHFMNKSATNQIFTEKKIAIFSVLKKSPEIFSG